MIKLRHIGRRGALIIAASTALLAGGTGAAFAATSGGQPTGYPTDNPPASMHCEYVLLTGQATDNDHAVMPYGQQRQGDNPRTRTAEIVTVQQWTKVCEDGKGRVTVTDVTDPAVQEWASEQRGADNPQPNPFASPTDQPTGQPTGSPSGTH